MNSLSGSHSRYSAGTSDIRYVKGIGPRRAEIFRRLGIHSLKDLFYLFPRRYEDRSRFHTLASFPLGEPATCRGEILEIKFKPIRRMPILEVLLGDDSGTLRAIFFNQPYLRRTFETGQWVVFHGKLENYEGRLQLPNPEFEIMDRSDENSPHVGRIVPIYPLTEGLFQRSLRMIMKDAIEKHLNETISDYLPPALRNDMGFVPLDRALHDMHFPATLEDQSRARQRLVFDDFFSFTLSLLIRVKTLRTQFQSPAIRPEPGCFEVFKKALPFELTGSQEHAMREIEKDVGAHVPMNRLLQGDVGSGKTVVAAFAFFLTARAGLQSAFLVPTEILAEQHFRTLSRLLTPLNITVELLTKSVAEDDRKRINATLKRGDLSVLVGTHALLQEDVVFHNLAMVTIDEQHKFGVHQRGQLFQRSPRPHQLVMTATPIPRTLGLTLFADLDVSLMREMPKGRKPIATYWISRAKQAEVYRHVARRLSKGEQAYIVFPVIEESEKVDQRAAKKEHSRLQKEVFPEFKVGLVHGKLDRSEREAIMRAFGRREIHVLVATSVIEVGVDQPNATVMIIENADRFGLAQLHQLRGRIGRGSLESECFLFGEPSTEEGKKRLRLLTKLNDGFLIAEEDLKLRGQGDLLGTRQAGVPFFRVANLATDEAMLVTAREKAVDVTNGLDLATLKNPNHWIQKYLEQMPKND